MDSWNEQSVVFAAEQITVLRFDPVEDLVWVGDSDGRVASFYGPMLHAYVSFIAHQGPIKDIQVSKDYVIVLGCDGVRSYTRNGILVAANAQAVGDVLLLCEHTQEFLVGYNRHIKRFTLDAKIKENGFFELDSIPERLHLTHMSLCSPHIAVGLSNGTAQVLETRTFDPILPKPITCHSGPLTALDSRKNVMATCGLSQRRYGLVPDVFVSCFDTQSRRSLPPLSVSTGASFVRLHPKAPNHAFILGSKGLLTFLDAKNPSSLVIKQVALRTLAVAFDLSSTGDSFVIAEKSLLHRWSSAPIDANNVNSFRGLAVPSAPEPLATIGDDGSFSLVGLPSLDDDLLSEWDPNITFEVGLPTPNWDKVENSLVAATHASTKVHRNKNRRSSSVSVPRFLSEQARFKDAERGTRFVDLIGTDDSAARGKVPKIWRQMVIHYSKFGVDDFDFSFYNKTEYAGLEPLSASRRCNAILQLYRWCPSIYNTVLHTFARNNWRELTVLGELAVVLDMLHQANGYHCRATNFMDTIQTDMTVTGFHAELLDQLREEYKQVDPNGPFPLDNEIKTISVDSAYTAPCPQWGLDSLMELPATLFISINEGSHAFTHLGPRIHSQFWVDFKGGNFKATTQHRTDYSYELRGYVAEVDDDGDSHAVAVINIDNRWYLFNDFLVTTISKGEALDFSKPWKRPCLLMYSYVGSNPPQVKFDYSWRDAIDTRLLRERRLASGNWNDPGNPDAFLKADEPIPELVALDAEFVLIRKEVSEVHSDGSKNLVSPKKLSLARLSVLRVNEEVLIDDMVESKQPVVDYVTAYSGIEPGDLDPMTSRFGLVARKTATRKLWILLNSGTKFVGHALVNDFRTINLYVPPAQVIDTYDLFYDRDRTGMRRLSLKFLMWAVLNQQVQTGNHDSVQDAQSALRLYKRYQELVNSNQVDDMLTDVAALGQRHNYRVPGSVGQQNAIGGPSAANSSGSGFSSIPTTPTRPQNY